MHIPAPTTALAEHQAWLVEEIRGTASWCGYVATLFANDSRSSRCCQTLYALAAAVAALPASHPLFERLADIAQVASAVRERWLDEVRLEFSNIGYLSAEGGQEAIGRLMAITEASLQEAHRNKRLH